MTDEKKCSVCGETKPLSEFYRRKERNGRCWSRCRSCQSIMHQAWKLKNPEYNREWYTKNKESHQERQRKRYLKNPLFGAEWRKKHPEMAKAQDRRKSLKKRSKPYIRASASISLGMRSSLRGGEKAGRHWELLAGYTANQLKRHLEKQFKPGMTWENYGSYWHIDHKIPISVFNFSTPEDIDFKRCWALKNLQPLEAKKNIQKQAKLERPFQPSLEIQICGGH